MRTLTTYISALLLCCLAFACKDDDSRTCLQCTNDQTTPDFELCQESNGNASVNGQDTGTDYNVYLDGLEEVGTTCN